MIFLSKEVGWLYFDPRGWVIFFLPERLGDFFWSREVGWFICPERKGDFFCPKRLGDFFLSREVGWFFLSQEVKILKVWPLVCVIQLMLSIMVHMSDLMCFSRAVGRTYSLLQCWHFRITWSVILEFIWFEESCYNRCFFFGCLLSAVAGFNHAKTIKKASAMYLHARQGDYKKKNMIP